MKICSVCKTEKERTEFYKRAASRDGLQPLCKKCNDIKSYKYYAAHPEKPKRYNAKWYRANKDRVRETGRRYRLLNPRGSAERAAKHRRENPEHCAAYRSWWKKRNKALVAAQTRRRQAAKMRATPIWANDFLMGEAYSLAALRTDMFGFPWDVDHVVPLQSELVCGLHTEHNLQVIPRAANISKGNRVWPDMPTNEADI